MSKTWYKRIANHFWDHHKDRIFVMHDRFTKDPYIFRYKILDCFFFKIRLHQIVRRDNEPKLHDHPWPFFHCVIAGGYIEDNDSGTHTRSKGFWAFRRAKYRHCISDILGTESWTLIIHAWTNRSWGFHCDEGWIQYDDYEKRREENLGWEC